jgi:hypothetical protein
MKPFDPIALAILPFAEENQRGKHQLLDEKRGNAWLPLSDIASPPGGRRTAAGVNGEG